MKPILDLTRAILDEAFFNNQFEDYATDKNVLFISPQLTGKQLYKSLLPYYCMYNETIFTAITGIEKYDPAKQLTDIEMPVDSKQILWADYIVLPFTTQSLTDGESNLYEAIRNINEECKIVYSIDFNFYELGKSHPYKKIFTPEVISQVEDNIWHCDICLLSNMAMREYLMKKLKVLHTEKYTNVDPSVMVACMPFIINTNIVLGNVDYDPQQPTVVEGNQYVEHNPKMEEKMQEVVDAAEVIKQKDLARKMEEAAKSQPQMPPQQ